MASRCLLLLLGSILLAGGAGAVDTRVLRVGTSGDYAPFSQATGDNPLVFEGFDIAMARAYAEERGLVLLLVPFRWPDLVDDLRSDKFDVAMSGVTVLPERSAAGRFSVPVLETGAVVIVSHPERFPDLASVNRRQIRVGVNAGGYLERAAAERFPVATLISISVNAAVREALLADHLDVAVSDTAEAPEWLRGTEGLAVLGPFTRDRKAYLVRADRPELAADLDRWLLKREADGSLAALRQKFFGDNAGPRVATPLSALLAAVDERVALMPIIAVAKRRAGIPLVVVEREETALLAAVRGVREAAAAAKVPPPSDALVRAVFRAQMEAAKQVQWSAIKDPDYTRPEVVPDIDEVLRPALIRIGERIAQLLVALPEGLETETVRAAALAQLRTPRLTRESKLDIADAVAELSQSQNRPADGGARDQ